MWQHNRLCPRRRTSVPALTAQQTWSRRQAGEKGGHAGAPGGPWTADPTHVSRGRHTTITAPRREAPPGRAWLSLAEAGRTGLGGSLTAHQGKRETLQARQLHQHPRETKHWFHSPLPERKGGDTYPLACGAHATHPAASTQAHPTPHERGAESAKKPRSRASDLSGRPPRAPRDRRPAPGSSGDRLLRH